MKILSFVEGVGGVGIGGVPTAALKIGQALAGRGHRVALNICGRIIPGAEELVEQSVGGVFQTVEDHRAFGIVTYTAHRLWAFAPSMLWRLNHRVVRQVDFVMLNSLYSFPVLAGYIIARLNKKPYGLWPHGVLAPFQRSISIRKKKIYNHIISRHILNEASVIFYTAIGEREETSPLNLTAPSVIIPLGIDTREYSQLPASGKFRDRYLNGHMGPLVLYLGRLNAKKGLDLLIESVAQVATQMPDVRLAIVGSGDPPEYLDQVKDWLRHHDIENRTVMTGLLTGQAKLTAFADADVFALPSHAENFCFAMFEAMASRVPVIISDNLNFAQEVKGHGAGLVVGRNPAEVATAILELLVDENLRKRMGESGFRLTQSYSWQNCGERIERTIDCVLHGIPFPADLTFQ
jgi:glycosyltransferase involved in cell wall biosynthesis